MSELSTRVLDAIKSERAKQVAQWGGHRHDSEHTTFEWAYFLSKQLERFEEASPRHIHSLNGTQTSALVKLAALAIAALECSTSSDDEAQEREEALARFEYTPDDDVL